MAVRRAYLAIDLKSFYASVECVARGLDPLTTNLVVADESRTDKTICLAVSPSLKACGVPGRPRLFEVRQILAQYRAMTGKTVEFIVATPRMQLYLDTSAAVYNVYLRYISAEDIHVYSVDEVFIDAAPYLRLYNMTPEELGVMLTREVLRETGITATVGVGTNLYLAKVAMDIVAKHAEPDATGTRIATLTERDYREKLWNHRPLTDFWRIGHGIARKLEDNGMHTMGDVARMSLLKNRYDPTSYRPDYPAVWEGTPGEDLLFRLFGVDAEILIDHAWGLEPCTIPDIKTYRPSSSSISVGQVLPRGYSKEEGLVILREMVDSLTMDLVGKGLVTNSVAVAVAYDREERCPRHWEELPPYLGPKVTDHYGRQVPKPVHGGKRLEEYTFSGRSIQEAAEAIYKKLVHPALLVRRLNVIFGEVMPERALERTCEQLDFFTDPGEQEARRKRLEREKQLQRAVLQIKGRFGKNAILKGTSYLEGATGRDRNRQVGGHRA